MSKHQDGLRIVPREAEQTRPSCLPSGILTCGLLLLGPALLLPARFPSVDIPWWLLFLGSMLPALALLWLHRSRAGRWCLPIGAGLLLVVCLIFRADVIAGLGALAGDLMDSLTVKTGRIHLDFAVACRSKVAWAVSPMLAIGVLLITQSIGTGRLFLALPVLLPVYLAVLVGLFPPDTGVILLAVGSVLLLVHRATVRGTGGSVLSSLTRSGITALCLALAMGLSLLLEPILPKDGTDSLEKALHRILHHTDTVSMPEGDLKDLGPWVKSNTPALELTMEAPGKIYLRGAVYDTYTGTAWENADSEILSANEDLFYWLHQSKFYGQSQIGLASRLTAQVTPQTMTIRNHSACTGHGYMPYALYGSETLDPMGLGDTSMVAVESVSYLPGSVPEWYLVQKTLAASQNRSNVQEYLAAEQAYEAYVTATDIQLTSDSWAVLQRRLEADSSPKTLRQIRQIIRDYLEENLVYDENVRTDSGNGDFLQYTLEQSGSGYSVHYATAATLLLRYFGVPARYVEGYFLSADEAAQYKTGQTILLTESHAHAWAEYYLPGVGFIPFEVTPGYMDDEELLLGGSDTLLEQTYQADNLKYAQVQQPEEIREPEQDRFSFSMKPWHLLVLLVLLLLGLAALVLYRRAELKKALQAIDQASHRDAIAMRYGYIRLLLTACPAEPPEGHEVAMALNQEALFSRHQMTQAQREQMDAYAAAVLTVCKTNWSWWQKLRCRLWDCLY